MNLCAWIFVHILNYDLKTVSFIGNREVKACEYLLLLLQMTLQKDCQFVPHLVLFHSPYDSTIIIFKNKWPPTPRQTSSHLPTHPSNLKKIKIHIQDNTVMLQKGEKYKAISPLVFLKLISTSFK